MPTHIRTVAVVGLGRIGALIALMLSEEGFEVIGLDARPRPELGPEVGIVDVEDAAALRAAVANVDAVISCLPLSLNVHVVRAAHAVGAHYLDLTEDVGTADLVTELAASARSALITQCGLAPGYVNVVAADLLARLDRPETLKVRVGALPQHPNGALGYAVNWSPEGLVNECQNDCEVIHRGRRLSVPALGDVEEVVIGGIQLEAATTSGGIGSLCETYEGTLNSLDYKTLRYPGHWRIFRAFLRDLRMGERPSEAAAILSAALPPTADDVVYVYLDATGLRGGVPAREQYVRAYRPRRVGGQRCTAIGWTTAASACAVLQLVDRGVLPGQGRIRQEEVGLGEFHSTSFGSLFADEA